MEKTNIKQFLNQGKAYGSYSSKWSHSTLPPVGNIISQPRRNNFLETSLQTLRPQPRARAKPRSCQVEARPPGMRGPSAAARPRPSRTARWCFSAARRGGACLPSKAQLQPLHARLPGQQRQHLPEVRGGGRGRSAGSAGHGRRTSSGRAERRLAELSPGGPFIATGLCSELPPRSGALPWVMRQKDEKLGAA